MLALFVCIRYLHVHIHCLHVYCGGERIMNEGNDCGHRVDADAVLYMNIDEVVQVLKQIEVGKGVGHLYVFLELIGAS